MIRLEQRAGLRSLKSCARAKLKAEFGKVNEAVKRIQTHNITELNSLLCHTEKERKINWSAILEKKNQEK